jgi:hypothetical protein
MSKGCKRSDYKNLHLNTKQFENEVKIIRNRSGKISSWKTVEEYRINNPSSTVQEEKEIKNEKYQA